MTRHLKYSLLAPVAALLVFAYGCEKPAEGTMPQMPPPMVSTTQAIARDVPEYLDEIGKCAAREYVAIKPQVAGKIQEIKFKDGADIKKGEDLFIIDPRPYKAAWDQANGMLAQSKAQQALATTEFNRVKDLPRNVEPQEDFDAKQNAIEVAAASIEASTAAVEVAKVNLDYCTIKSPIDGRAGQRLVDMGNVVNPNLPAGSSADSGSTLLTIQRLNPIYADFTVNENELARVRAEMSHGTLKTLVKLPEDKEYRDDGELTFLDNSVQDGSGTIKLRATLHNADQHFWPGQFVNVRLILMVKKNAVLVPSSVPQISQKGSYALVVKHVTGKDGKPATVAEMRPVTLGQRHGDMLVLETGVNVGEEVITNGQMMVQPNMPVNVLAATVAKPAPPPTDADPSKAKKASDEGEK